MRKMLSYIYKCPYAVRGMLISEVWNKVEYLEMHEGKLELKRMHRYYTQITGDMAMSGLERLFFVVWTGKGDPFVELIHVEQQVLPNLSARGNSWVYTPYCPERQQCQRLQNVPNNDIECGQETIWGNAVLFGLSLDKVGASFDFKVCVLHNA